MELKTLFDASPFWFSKPAEDWTSAIPIGNGGIGATIFGGVSRERILVNEATIWCGGPAPQPNREGPALIERMRELLFAGKNEEAEIICRDDFLEPDDEDELRGFQPAGWIEIAHHGVEGADEYRRELSLDSAIASTQFSSGGISHSREAFVSAPDQVLVCTYTSDAPEAISFTVSLGREFGAEVRADGGRLLMRGRASAADGTLTGTTFDMVVTARTKGGTVETVGEKLTVTNANEATLMVSVATDNNFSDPTSPVQTNLEDVCNQTLARANRRDNSKIRMRHVADYQELFMASTLKVSGGDPHGLVPLDERVAKAAKDGADTSLLMLYYAYARYIFISSSRHGGLPINLQGLWNPLMAPPWRSDWHLNINVQEAYWFAEQGGLPECHEPLFSLVENLIPSGQEAARTMLGVSRGFFAGVRTDGTLFAAPSQKPLWGMYVVGAAWCAQHVMEHYRFTQDTEFLKSRGLPILRENALFWLDWLVPNPETGLLVSGPTASAENEYVLPNGTKATIAMGPSQDQEIAWASLRDFIEACDALGIEDEDVEAARLTLDQLALPEVAPDGRLREWPEDWVEAEPGHRHLSHLWGMMAGDRITLRGTPDLAAAVKKSLEGRLANGYDAQGWSLGWVANMFARLGEGDRALELLEHKYFRHVWPNLFVVAHDEVQVGDMMGAALAMIEMLLQSHAGEIELLPALPQEWTEGTVEGLRARGGYAVDITWSNGKLDRAVISSELGGKTTLRYADDVLELVIPGGGSVEYTGHGRIRVL